MTAISADGWNFDFDGAVSALKFDDSHSAPMKGVDVIVEFPDAYVFIEIKEYIDPSEFDPKLAGTDDEMNERKAKFKWLKGYLKYKFRDTFLYRQAAGKNDRKIHYVCLITFDNALNNNLSKQLKSELPIGKACRHWVTELANSCHVVNVERWEKNWPKWQIERA